MSQQLVTSSTTANTPWKQSAKGSICYIWRGLPDGVKSQLKQEDKFGITSGDFHYSVKQNQDGGYIVFTNTKAEYEARSNQQSFRKMTDRTKVQALPIEATCCSPRL